ncbi:MAG: hypothetical protein U1C49_01225 [Candidatus Andersenbacteria bacterium]|nr:hypothetical protein [bacterium]MDZ4225447.1 hypothetical protein [Candidatus Andersenbacteria bacterium]
MEKQGQIEAEEERLEEEKQEDRPPISLQLAERDRINESDWNMP